MSLHCNNQIEPLPLLALIPNFNLLFVDLLALLYTLLDKLFQKQWELQVSKNTQFCLHFKTFTAIGLDLLFSNR